MFIRNLNVFVPCSVIACVTIGAWVGLLITFALIPLRSIVGELVPAQYTFQVGYLAVGAFLAIAWWRKGLSPAERKPELEGRFNTGHRLLAVASVLVLVTFAGPILLANVTGNFGLANLAWFAVPVFGLAFIAWPVGLFMVWSSRA